MTPFRPGGNALATARSRLSTIGGEVVRGLLAHPKSLPPKLFYDDIGCLAKAVAAGKPLEHAYVADHRTREWVPAGEAAFTRVPALETPMSSHIIAHANDE